MMSPNGENARTGQRSHPPCVHMILFSQPRYHATTLHGSMRCAFSVKGTAPAERKRKTRLPNSSPPEQIVSTKMVVSHFRFVRRSITSDRR